MLGSSIIRIACENLGAAVSGEFPLPHNQVGCLRNYFGINIFMMALLNFRISRHYRTLDNRTERGVEYPLLNKLISIFIYAEKRKLFL